MKALMIFTSWLMMLLNNCGEDLKKNCYIKSNAWLLIAVLSPRLSLQQQ